MTRTLESARALRPARFAHFVIRVRDLQRSIDWYEKVIGMQMVHRGEKLAFMSYDEEHHRVALAETPVEHEAPPGAPGLDHVAYAFETLGELLSTYRRLETLGIKPYLPINHGPTTSLYYHDPDGNGVEFQVDNFETEAELKGWMESEAFLANPIGVPFDPEKLIERYLAGDPLEALLRQGAA
ncbi:MAG: VOC family protein [Myxococcota bacterium]|nr:VOC family protein [Myxococcota bacterium]